jgi:hypothetical protein
MSGALAKNAAFRSAGRRQRIPQQLNVPPAPRRQPTQCVDGAILGRLKLGQCCRRRGHRLLLDVRRIGAKPIPKPARPIRLVRDCRLGFGPTNADLDPFCQTRDRRVLPQHLAAGARLPGCKICCSNAGMTRGGTFGSGSDGRSRRRGRRHRAGQIEAASGIGGARRSRDRF